MADVWEKDLAQKSSLTVNDYIRVVGSDNASYKQLITAVAKTIVNYELNASSSASSFNSGDDLNDFKTAGMWRSGGSASSASIVNTPTTTAGYLLLVLNLSSSFTVQIAITANSPSVTYKRAYRVSNTTWSAWEQVPTRAEVDALNSKSKGTLTGEHISSTLIYQKCGNMCTVKINALKDLAGETETELGTLPTGYRPYDSPVQFAVGTPSSSGFSRIIRITINVGGAITAYLYGTTALSGAINVRGCVTFPT